MPWYLRLHLTDGPAAVRELDPGIYSVGADPENRIALMGRGISGRHAILTLRATGAWIEDLDTPGGTYLDECAITGRVSLPPGQPVRIGPCRLTLFTAPPPPEEETAPPAAPPAPAVAAPSSLLPDSGGRHEGPPSVGENKTVPQSSGGSGSVPTVPVPAPDPVPAPAPAPDLRVMAQKQTIKRQIHRELLTRLDIKRLTATQVDERELHKRVLHTVETIVGEVSRRLPPEIQVQALIKEIYDEAVGLGPLEDLLADDDVNEIMVNGPNRIYIERHGRIELTDRVFLDDRSVMAIIERIVSPLGRRIDESQPFVDARLRDGSRVNAIIHPLSLTGPSITIRKFARVPFTEEDLIRMGTWTHDMADFLNACVRARKNLVISGGTGSGKTTLLNVISRYLPEEERIVTIEDAAELRLKQPHVISLEARMPNIEGKGAVTIRDLVRNSLRMRPDRIVVGECRGGEALDMLQAMNTGHDGSLTTIHANSPRDVISRLETLVLMAGMDLPLRAIREQIASAVDIIVHEARFSDGTRKVTAISEIVGLEGEMITMQELYGFARTGVAVDGRILGRFRPTGAVPTFMEELRTKGIAVNQAIFDPQSGGGGS